MSIDSKVTRIPLGETRFHARFLWIMTIKTINSTHNLKTFSSPLYTLLARIVTTRTKNRSLPITKICTTSDTDKRQRLIFPYFPVSAFLREYLPESIRTISRNIEMTVSNHRNELVKAPK